MSLLKLLERLASLPRRIWAAWMTALTEARIRKSLRVDHALLAWVAAGIPSRDPAIPDSADYICPELTIHAAGFNRYVAAATATLSLVLDLEGRRQVLLNSTFELRSRPNEFGGVAVKWRGTGLAGSHGPGVLRVLVADRELSAFPVTFLNSADLAAQVCVSNLQLNAVLQNGKTVAFPLRVVRDQIKTVGPSCRIETPVLAPNTELTGRIVIVQASRIMVRAAFRMDLSKPCTDLQVRSSAFPSDLDPTLPMVVRVEIMNLVKAKRTITVLGAPPITTFDGALTADASHLPVG